MKMAEGRLVASALCLITLCAAVLAQCGTAGRQDVRAETMAAVRNLGPGWNLGNTLDAHEKGFRSRDVTAYERLWQNPPASRGLLEAVYAAGFRTLRVPVTWYPHMGADHQVDPAWLRRVAQVVDDALETGFHVIINAHHEDWYSPYAANMDYAAERLASLWAQVAEHFADYDRRLLFEGMNEPRLVGDRAEWTCGTPGARDGVNHLNQVFVDTVRAAGGCNAERLLLLPTYCASLSEEACTGFTLPQDDRVAASLHVYQPFPFTHEAEASGEWSADDPAHRREVDAVFSAIDRHFTSKGIPVAITEFGAIDKDNGPARAAWAGYLAGLAAKSGVPCLWWDNGAAEGPGPLNTFSLIDRNTLEWHHPELAQAIIGAYAGGA